VRRSLGIEREAQEAVLEDPYSRKETQVKTSEGLNEVQGTADLKMSRPENSDAISVEDKSKNFWKHLQVKNDTGNGLRTKASESCLS